jgi:diaminopimelate epimerase
MIEIHATYGHGTENDFVLIFDPEDSNPISAEDCARICDRKNGIGADGLIRILKREGLWFMDYRNRDGSIAEMCGNGIRLMARYLVDRGHQAPGIFPISTRSGKKFISTPESGDITVNMGQVSLLPGEVKCEKPSIQGTGVKVDVGNPHTVFFVDSLAEAGDLNLTPKLNPESPDGTNVEFVHLRDDGELEMRVYERGVGETQSCGTGTCAVALAATIRAGAKLPSKWIIYPPGGRLVVEIDSHSNAILTGPALLIKDIDISKFITGSSK